jgi:hypothetical protein
MSGRNRIDLLAGRKFLAKRSLNHDPASRRTSSRFATDPVEQFGRLHAADRNPPLVSESGDLEVGMGIDKPG